MMLTPKTRVILVAASLVVIFLLLVPWRMGKKLEPVRTNPAPLFVDVAEGKLVLNLFRMSARVDGNIPSAIDLEHMTDQEVHIVYHSFLDNMDILCHRKLRMGNMGDGGWEVCDDAEYRPESPCVVYSFGINNDFSFDDDVARLYACDVFAFDPSMNTDSYRRSNKVSFYNLGLGGKDGQLQTHGNDRQRWVVKSLSDIKTMLNHTGKTIDILKMDIEESEWVALSDMVETGELSHVRQLLVEFHIFDQQATGEMRKQLPLLASLHQLGFRRYYTHMNPMCLKLDPEYPVGRSRCYEVYFLNTKLARTVQR